MERIYIVSYITIAINGMCMAFGYYITSQTLKWVLSSHFLFAIGGFFVCFFGGVGMSTCVFLFFNYSNHQKFSFEKMKLNGGVCSTSSLKLNNLKLIVFLVSWLLLSITELFWNLKYPKVVVSSSMRPWYILAHDW